MKVLFVFFVPSGGMETLNRQRCQALIRCGIQAECLYYEWGAGLQNKTDYPIYVTNDDHRIRELLLVKNYDTVVVTTDHTSFERFRRLGYRGRLVLEIQGYGGKEIARQQLTAASPAIHAHAAALLNPNTPHIATLFRELFPGIPQFHINNCFDAERFKYKRGPQMRSPILAWIGRIEDNKNWREFLYIAHSLIFYKRDLQIWMFEDINLSIPSEREKFLQLLDQLRFKSRLKLRSNVPNHKMMSYYSMIADSGGLMCSTSKTEGSPLSILEAMSCRCPVLASTSDGVDSLIIHNVTGKSYILGDIGQAVQQARELMDHTEQREEIQKKALEHVQKEFNANRYCREFIKMLRYIS